jgi:branched-chain amino acid transport system substrate-binding protein
MKKFQKIGSVAVILILFIALIGWRIYERRGQNSGPIKIGVATILSGDWASLGENILNTAELTVDQINADGGVNGRKLEIVSQDSGIDGPTGLSAVSELINIEGVHYIVGGMASNGTDAAASILNQDHVLDFVPVTGGKDVDNDGPYVFRTANSDSLAGTDIADAMIGLGYKHVGIVDEVSDYSVDLTNSFKQEFASRGGTIVDENDFQPETSDFKTIIAKFKTEKIQAMLIASQTGISGAFFVKQARDLAFTPPMFSDFTFVTNAAAQKIVGSFNGIYFADPSYDAADPDLQAFFRAYKDKYGYAPTIPFQTAATYDAIHMLASAIQAVSDNSVGVHDWLLANIKNYHGFMGTYSLDAEGNSDLGFTVKLIKNGQPTPVTY